MQVLTEERIAHSKGVAEYMYEHAEDYDLSPDTMYLLGLIHDIGYLYGKPDHEALGGKLLEYVGYNQCSAVSWHGTTPHDYMRLRDVDTVPSELHLLWEADMSINSKGERVSFDERLEDIGTRLGYDSFAYSQAKETIEWLRRQDR